MAVIDNLLASQVIAEVAEKLSGLSHGKKIAVPFEALELGAQAQAELETDITTLMGLLATAKSWNVRIDFIGRVVIFHV